MSRRAPDRHPLNPEQLAAVRHLDGPVLVLAGAGSGKTRVITAKLARLILHGGYAPGEVAAVTFTNKAAREMRERAIAQLGRERAEGLAVSTFHTLGLRILQAEARGLGYKRGFSIFDAEDQRKLLAELLKAERLDRNEVIDRVHWKIQAWKSALVTPEEALATAAEALDVQSAAAYAAYDRHLKAYNAVDFDDLIMKPVRLLESDAMVRERWQTSLRYLLVDEYQDTNGAQYRLLKALTGRRAARGPARTEGWISRPSPWSSWSVTTAPAAASCAPPTRSSATTATCSTSAW
jgi:ATP-dependent DNA helicase Rep